LYFTKSVIAPLSGDVNTFLNAAKSFQFAVTEKAHVISASWAGWLDRDQALLSTVRSAVDDDGVVSWFHYPHAYPGLLRSRSVYHQWGEPQSLDFSDRCFLALPGFHPVKIEAGLSQTAPQAAGIAALARSCNPDLTPKEVDKLIRQNSTPIGRGIPIPDAYKTVLAAQKARSGR